MRATASTCRARRRWRRAPRRPRRRAARAASRAAGWPASRTRRRRSSAPAAGYCVGPWRPRSASASRRGRWSSSTSRRSRATRRALAAHVSDVLAPAAWPCATSATPACSPARRDAPPVLLAGPPRHRARAGQPARAGSTTARVHGLGASDMKGALAVMIELALAGARPYRCLFFGREELPVVRVGAHAAARARAARGAELVVMMEPTACELHAGCLGQHQRDVDVPRALGPLRAALAGRQRDRARRRGDRRARRAGARAAHEFDGPRVRRGRERHAHRRRDRRQRDPRPRASATSTSATPPGRTPAEAEARLRELCAGHGELRIESNAPSGRWPTGPRSSRRLIAAGGLTRRAEAGVDAGRRVRHGRRLDAVNFGPGDPAQAHRRDESVEIAALVRALPGAGGATRRERLSPAVARPALRRLPVRARSTRGQARAPAGRAAWT